MKEYIKAGVAVAGAATTAALGIWSTGDVGNGLTVLSATLTAIGVYYFPNASGAPEKEW